MSVEIRTVGKRKKYYLSHSYRKDSKVTKVRVFLGTNLTKEEIDGKIADATVELKDKMRLGAVPEKYANIKLIAFDLDGTLVYYPKYKSAFEVADALTRLLYYDRKFYPLFENRKLSVSKGAEIIFRRYKERGLTEKKLMRAFRNQMRLMPGVRPLFAELKKRNVKVAIISGGLKNAYDAFVDKFGITADFVRIAHELRFDRRGNIMGGNYSEYDYEGKIEALREICEDLNIGLKNCAFVGDWKDDIPIFKKVGLSIAINTRTPKVLEAAKVTIKGKDIRKILDYL